MDDGAYAAAAVSSDASAADVEYCEGVIVADGRTEGSVWEADDSSDAETNDCADWSVWTFVKCVVDC